MCQMLLWLGSTAAEQTHHPSVCKRIFTDESCIWCLQTQNASYPLLSDQGGALRKGFGIKGNFLGLVPGREVSGAGRCGRAW